MKTYASLWKTLPASTLLLGALVLPGKSNADELRCDNCSEASYAQMAKSANIGTHYVYDLHNGQVRKYFVEREPGTNANWIYYADSLPVESDVNYVVTTLSSFYHSTNRTMSARYVVTANGPIGGLSGFDGAMPGGGRTAIFDWLQTNVGMENIVPINAANIRSLVAAALNIFKQVPVKTLVTVQFSDGSTITIDYNALNDEITFVNALDAAGNPIPTSSSEATGINFDFTRDPTGQASGRMSFWLQRLGALVSGTGTSGMACTESAAGVHCVKY